MITWVTTAINSLRIIGWLLCVPTGPLQCLALNLFDCSEMHPINHLFPFLRPHFLRQSLHPCLYNFSVPQQIVSPLNAPKTPHNRRHPRGRVGMAPTLSGALICAQDGAISAQDGEVGALFLRPFWAQWRAISVGIFWKSRQDSALME